MSVPNDPRRPSRSRPVPLACAAVVATLLALALAYGLPGAGAPPGAAAQSGGGEPTPQADASVPARNVTMIGSTPQEAGAPCCNETWGVGREGSSAVLVRYASESGWSLGPALEDSSGNPLTGFALDQPGTLAASPLAAQMTPAGSGVMVGTTGGGTQQVVLVRDPGGSFKEAQPLPTEGEAALKSGEALFGSGRAPLIAPLEEGSGRAGALVVPVKLSGGVEGSVLHWDGKQWTRESIAVPSASASDLRVLGIGATSPTNAWLLAQLATGSFPVGSVALFRREAGEGSEPPSWRPVELVAGNGDGQAHPLKAPLQSGEAPFTVLGTGEPPTVQTQVLTVTSQGVWVDGVRTDVQASATLLFKPEGEAGGHVDGAWCSAPLHPAGEEDRCVAGGAVATLPQRLSTRAGRSFAWASASAFGERVITGFGEGISLRLEGSAFKEVLSLGASEAPRDVGGTYGAAFANAREGWLGHEALPVHLTQQPVGSRLSTWPVPFRHALLAIAPQPGAPVGAPTSEALAVGDQGEVARYVPGSGWLPESLLSIGGRREAPRLRAVAWPQPGRAYAVGDRGQMWLWRGETGLWERDPATPVNFLGNLLGVAFDPSNPARGYAVGQGGVLLRYGKSWSQEASLPAQVAGADFTSIAFAGSEAIVAYRKLLNPNQISSYVGGLLVNEGAGWRVDEGAAAALGSEVPSVVAGLSDGGAATAAVSPTGGLTRVFERAAAGASWAQVATPLPRGGSPGSLAIFREGGAVRVIATGTLGGVETIASSPPGFPPPLVPPYAVSSSSETGVLRQTGSGWSDEQHELNDAREPPGNYKSYDTVYEPDPIAAVLVDPSGAQGWAVGGFVEVAGTLRGALDTADVERYPADGLPPPGRGQAPVPLTRCPTNPAEACPAGTETFAVGGGAQCAAPCADRANAGVGPDVWLSGALSRAREVGVHDFFYTGPGVSSGETSGETVAFPFARELDHYAAILGSGGVRTWPAASPEELDARPVSEGTEATFEEAFGGFEKPQAGCFANVGCQHAYYAVTSGGVRVIVLDDTHDVEPSQLAWLDEQLKTVERIGPAVVVGNADLGAQVRAGDVNAANVVNTLIADKASAYFYDAPEANVEETLRSGAGTIRAYGSGTLGYVAAASESSREFLGTSGFLLVQIDPAARSEGPWPVEVRLIPNIGELALEAQDGTLIQRSHAALFSALARRLRSGSRAQNASSVATTSPYIPIPSICVGVRCEGRLEAEYRFTSSNPEIGEFVKPNLAANEARAVELGANGKPIPDPESGLFCAYNPGETKVTISSGGLSATLNVVVQNGSVRRPCGTTPLHSAASQSQPVSAPPPAPSPSPASAAPASALAPAVPLPAPPAATPAPPARPVPAALPFLLPPAAASPVLAAVPPPVPTPARPTPPSGTSAVTSPVEAPEREEEEEEATESVGNKAVAYRGAEHQPQPEYILGIVALAAAAGASARRRPRRGRRDVRVAPATVTGAQAQRRMSRHERR